MCNCKTHPNINGEPGYAWNDNNYGVRKPEPPPLEAHDKLIHDEPGRCGGIDAHAYHFRLVRNSVYFYLLVRHGGGDERIRLGCTFDLVVKAGTLDALDTHGRFWLLKTIYNTHRDATSEARKAERAAWMQAAAEKRIKTKKLRNRDSVKVWIEEKQVA